jgi:hypothetical protein
VSAYSFTLASLTQIDSDDLSGWVERAVRDLEPDTLVRGRETDAVLPLTATVARHSVRLTVYKHYGRVRLEAIGADSQAVERYLCDQLELTVLGRVERTLPADTTSQVQDKDQQQVLMEAFRALAGGRRGV